MMFLSPFIRTMNYYIPGFSSLLYLGILGYVIYSNYKRAKYGKQTYHSYTTNNAYHTHSTSQNAQSANHSTSGKVKSDVIDVNLHKGTLNKRVACSKFCDTI